jgi:aspartyl-tRNA(Asn)/glutamyl-tRNA(Gln) amidotransferase subunit C
MTQTNQQTEIDIQKIANLARIDLNEQEKIKFTQEIHSILGYIKKIMAVNVDNIEPLIHTFDAYNIWQDDIPTAPFSPAQALLNSKYQKDNQVVVPKVVE